MEVFLPPLSSSADVFSNLPFSLLWNSLSHTECGLGNSLALNFAESQGGAKNFKRNVHRGKKTPKNKWNNGLRGSSGKRMQGEMRIWRFNSWEIKRRWGLRCHSARRTGPDTSCPSLARPCPARAGPGPRTNEPTQRGLLLVSLPFD